jgi:hypothetical protein
MTITASFTAGNLAFSSPALSPGPPAYSSPPSDSFDFLSLSTSAPTLTPRTPLPSYYQLPSLEPWLRVLRSDIHFGDSFSSSSAAENLSHISLELFVPSHVDGWPELHTELVCALKSWGLSSDPHEDVRAQLWPVTPQIRKRIKTDTEWLPDELRNTALWMTQTKEIAEVVRGYGLEISPVLLGVSPFNPSFVNLFLHVLNRCPESPRRRPDQSPPCRGFCP